MKILVGKIIVIPPPRVPVLAQSMTASRLFFHMKAEVEKRSYLVGRTEVVYPELALRISSIISHKILKELL